MFLFTLLCYLTVRLEEDFSWGLNLAIGAALGLGLLTQLYFLVALIPILSVSAYRIWRDKDRVGENFKKVVSALAIACAFVLPWEIHVRRLYQVWLLTYENLQLNGLSWTAKLSAVFRIPWAHEFGTIGRSFIWIGNWSFLEAPKPVYDFSNLLMLLAVAGLLLWLYRNSREFWNVAVLPLS